MRRTLSPCLAIALSISLTLTLALMTAACGPDRSGGGGGGDDDNNGGTSNNTPGNNDGDPTDVFGTGDPVTTVPGNVPPNQLDNLLIEILCGKIYQCEEETAEARAQIEAFFNFQDEASCKTSLGGFIGAQLETTLNDGIQKNRVRYNGTIAGQCLNTYNRLGCRAFNEDDALGIALEELCRGMFIGQQDVGDECAGDHECKGEGVNFCREAAEDEPQPTPPLIGACAPLGQEGEPCDDDEQCVAGLHCDLSAAEQVCRSTPGLGEPCTNTCEGDLYCDFSTQTCAAIPGDGEPCTGQCDSGLTCNFETNTCQPLPGVGEPCDFDCADGAICSGGTCHDPADLEPCGSGGTCEEGFTCNFRGYCVEGG